MLKLRSGMVVSLEPLVVDVRGERRAAWADPGLVGEVAVGDEVIVNVEAADLGLGSGGVYEQLGEPEARSAARRREVRDHREGRR